MYFRFQWLIVVNKSVHYLLFLINNNFSFLSYYRNIFSDHDDEIASDRKFRFGMQVLFTVF